MKKFSIILIVMCLSIVFAGNSYAAKGVSNSKVTPGKVWINTDTTIRASAVIGSDNLITSSVGLYQTTAAGQPIRLISLMYDDGTHGDVSPADGVYTTQYTMNQPTQSAFYVRVTAAYRGDRNRYMGPVQTISVYQPSSCATSTLYFSPASTSVNVGQDFTLDAIVDPGTNSLGAIELHISYDPTKFSLKSYTSSSAFGLILYTSPILTPQDGSFRADCGVPLGIPDVTTTAKVITFSFHALAPVVNSSITFTAESLLFGTTDCNDDTSLLSTIIPTSVTVAP
jgi:hypothetical protein